MIPHIIHYCWFGKSEKSDLIKQCIQSWKRFCPEFEIIEWNEENININELCSYAKEAYEAQKWAFVSDYIRHMVLNEYGGIYLDTDVELLRPLDSFLYCNFLALETSDSINTGLIMGCEKENKYCQWMLSSYNKDHFLLDDGNYNTYTVCERTTEYFTELGFMHSDTVQSIDGFQIYPTEYFCPKNPITFEVKLTENTISIHHYGASWCTTEQKEYLLLRSQYVKKYSYNVASVFAYFKVKKKYHSFGKAVKLTLRKVLKKNKR